MFIRTHYVMSEPIHDECFYVSHAKDDPAKEPISIGTSIPGIIAYASQKTGRTGADFEVEEITEEQFQVLRQFL
jgi:hypothetical protein